MWTRRACLVGVAVLLGLLTLGTGAAADPPFVKYYVVPEAGPVPTLAAIAGGVLGREDRQSEIFALNVGRRQADGAALTEPGVLRPGWLLVLPWDAAGPGVRYGQLPDASPAGGAAAVPQVPAATSCGLATAPGVMPLSWAQLRMAPGEAWTRSRGAGVTVAVVDAAVPDTTPALAGRVLPAVALGAAPPGDARCAGRGAALAGILAAGPRPSSNLIGMAPEASVLPIEVAVTDGYVTENDAARALDSAVRRKAGVVMIAAQIRPGGAQAGGALVGALARAAAAGAVVVLAAPARDGGPSAVPPPTPAVLRVGAVSADDRLAGRYVAGGVDVLAPGVNILTLGADGEVEATGTDFAVPFVAGLAALVRGAEPGLSAAEVAERIARSADGGRHDAADPERGWGVIDPGVAVGVARPGVPGPARPSTDSTPLPALLLTVAALAAAVTAVLLIPRLKRRAPS